MYYLFIFCIFYAAKFGFPFSPRDDTAGPEVLGVVPADLVEEVSRLFAGVEGDDPHALAGAVLPGPAVSEAPLAGLPGEQVVLAVPHVVALAPSARPDRGAREPRGAWAVPWRKERAFFT